MSYSGFYINLDRCPDRSQEIGAELARFGLGARYRRFAASDGNALNFPNPRLNTGEMRCFTSHYRVLKDNLAATDHLHIVEDDALFASSTASVIERVINSGEINGFDILFTDVAIPLSNDAYKNFKALYDSLVTRNATGALESVAFQILKLNQWTRPAASSYIVNKAAIDKIYLLYHEELTTGARLPVDSFLCRQAETGAIKAGFIFPFITAVRPERAMTSTVRKVPDTTMKFTASDIARMSFFIGCDWSECEALFDRLIPSPPPGDKHAHILSRVLSFSLVDGIDHMDMSDAEKPAKAS
jgi:GR25 family glycosyltransferase involved in LPS biosynthesis